eukprot:CAMPEP_0202861938 /NCGR_PEP_ID=MMETSP1391-20130828/3163_1 /ASSEMBLY_ACC=CAM_ASM_000867 /TAXON_ID=1034604 /ORGANISM="Chlamydomonas leiostraca, Strain SAG 11-49" /LENGTH=73 /DNA_ID=CAMNT_0049541399 /DNA_START=62 /DNA_END=279 /DNA_ORIENTATION=-
MPIIGSAGRTVNATNDIFAHARWAHHIKTDASMARDANIVPDMTDFYARFSKGSGAKGGAKKGGGGPTFASSA